MLTALPGTTIWSAGIGPGTLADPQATIASASNASPNARSENRTDEWRIGASITRLAWERAWDDAPLLGKIPSRHPGDWDAAGVEGAVLALFRNLDAFRTRENH